VTSATDIQATKIQDTTTVRRDIRLQLVDAPPMEHWLSKPHHSLFLPQSAYVEIVNGRLLRVMVSGPMRRKDGSPSRGRSGNRNWRGEHFEELAPQWLVERVQQCIASEPEPLAPGSEAGIAL
jgi:hypothetical protein